MTAVIFFGKLSGTAFAPPDTTAMPTAPHPDGDSSAGDTGQNLTGDTARQSPDAVEAPFMEATHVASDSEFAKLQDLTRQSDPEETSAPSDADRLKRKLRISAQLGIPLDPPQREDAIGTLGNYQILEKVGRGGMGIVMRAFDTVLHRQVALKVMSASLVSSDRARVRFSREARSAASINHANVVTIHAIEEQDEIPYLVMEYVEGQTIEQLVRSGHHFDIEEMIRISAQVAAGLAEAHSQGVIHRDIKPSNILLDSLQRAKITDFGLARLAMDNSDLTSQGDVLGTPSYMSPEQVRGEEASESSDLFSLGCLFYAMIAGQSPFHATTQIGTATRIQNEDPSSLLSLRPDVPRELNDLIMNLLAKDPGQRPTSAADVTQRLNRMLAAINQQSSHAVQPASVASPSPGKSRVLPIATVLAVIAGCIAYLVFVEPDEVTAPQTFVPAVPIAEGQAASKQIVDVAADGSGDFASISEAIASVGPDSTIHVHSGAYVESLVLDTDERFRGLTIEGIGMPTLSQPSSKTLMEIENVTNLTLKGLKFSGQHDQSALRIRGQCDGLTISHCEFVGQPLETNNPLAMVHIAATSGTEQAPIQLISSKILDARIGLVIGMKTTGADPTKHVVVRDCELRCVSADAGIPLVMIGRLENIEFKNNLLSLGNVGLSFQLLERATAKSLRIERNTIHAENIVLHFNRSVADQDVRLVNNLFVGSSQMQPNQTRLQGDFHKWFDVNGWITFGEVNDSFLQVLRCKRFSVDVLQSLDPGDETYLQPSALAPKDLPGTRRTIFSSADSL